MEIKSISGWHEFAKKNTDARSWGDYAHPGDYVDEGVYDYFLEILPPRIMERGYLQAGEPHSHRMNAAIGRVQATYATFQKVRKGVWMYLGNCFAGGTWEPEMLRFDSLREFLKKTYRIRGAIQDGRPHIFCKDGFKMSVQAGVTWYCLPRKSLESGEYEAVEVGALNREDELLMPYAEDAEKPTKTVYAYVPVEVVDAVIQKHGGLYG